MRTDISPGMKKLNLSQTMLELTQDRRGRSLSVFMQSHAYPDRGKFMFRIPVDEQVVEQVNSKQIVLKHGSITYRIRFLPYLAPPLERVRITREWLKFIPLSSVIGEITPNDKASLLSWFDQDTAS